MPQVMNGEEIRRAIRRITHEILERHRGAESVVIVGIHTRGAHLARRLGDLITELEEAKVPVGELDVTDHRDDDAIRTRRPRRLTDIPADITDRNLILVDDVLYTGRTVRAGLDALSELGRAATVELAVLVDRGHRQLPIRADYVGKNLPTSRDQVVRVRLAPHDPEDGVWLEGIG